MADQNVLSLTTALCSFQVQSVPISAARTTQMTVI